MWLSLAELSWLTITSQENESERQNEEKRLYMMAEGRRHRGGAGMPKGPSTPIPVMRNCGLDDFWTKLMQLQHLGWHVKQKLAQDRTCDFHMISFTWALTVVCTYVSPVQTWHLTYSTYNAQWRSSTHDRLFTLMRQNSFLHCTNYVHTFDEYFWKNGPSHPSHFALPLPLKMAKVQWHAWAVFITVRFKMVTSWFAAQPPCYTNSPHIHFPCTTINFFL